MSRKAVKASIGLRLRILSLVDSDTERDGVGLQAYSGGGRTADQLQLLQGEAARHPHHVPILSELATVLFAVKRFDQAMAVCRQILLEDPRDVGAMNVLGQCFLATRDPVQAESAFRMGIAVLPELPNLHYNLGLALQAQARIADAIAAYAKAVEPSARGNTPLAVEKRRTIGLVVSNMKRLIIAGLALASLSMNVSNASLGPKPSHGGEDPLKRQLATADLDRAKELEKSKDTLGAIAAAKKAVEEDPELLEAHEQFVRLTEESIIKRDSSFEKTEAEAVATLKSQYDAWSRTYPNSAGVQYGIGSVYSDSEDPRAKPYLLKAVSLNPKLAKAYEMLSFDAERWGDERAAREYMGKAAAAEPTEASYAFYYADFFRDSDPNKYKLLSLQVVKNFPDTERGAQALYWLGQNSGSDAEKIMYAELSRTQFPPSKFSWSAASMSVLFDVYARTDPGKALALANEMASTVSKEDLPEWTRNAALGRNLVEVQNLMAAGQYAEAKTLLDNSKISRYSSDLQMFELLKAKATAAAGDTKGAYDALVSRFAKSPEDPVREAITKYGMTLGKTPEQIDADIWAVRDQAAKLAPSFDLPLYLSKGNRSLQDYKGKVVLLTFWFPGCGPCRGEFPHFEQVMKRFRGKNVAYVGINVLPSQDEYVRPFMKGTHYSFTPLRGSSEFAQSAYHVRGEPTNFLIDPAGRIVFTNFRAQDPESERSLELMIQSLLDHHVATQ